jgi:hypothetical protein
METKFTKGKWDAVIDEWQSFINSDDGLIAELGFSHVTHQTAVSNAHLIAAAPEMYQALEQIMTTLSSDGFGCFDNTCSEIGKLLAKARGEHGKNT